MNFFFGFKNNNFYSELTIPKFQNSGKRIKDPVLFSAEPVNNSWKIEKVENRENDEFYFIRKEDIDSTRIFFIGTKNDEKELIKNKNLELKNLNNFTDTTPEFRANLKIKNNQDGYSSYQSDYPYEMTKINGSITASLFPLTNKNADKNYVILRNIFFKPKKEDFEIFIINKKEKKILSKKFIKTNYTSLIELENKYLDEDCYLFSKNYVGIPIFLTSKKNHLSLEHTLPLTSYILSSNKYKLVSDIKKELNEIVS